MFTPPGEIPEKGMFPAEMTGVANAGTAVKAKRARASTGRRPDSRNRDGRRSPADMRALVVNVSSWSIRVYASRRCFSRHIDVGFGQRLGGARDCGFHHH